MSNYSCFISFFNSRLSHTARVTPVARMAPRDYRAPIGEKSEGAAFHVAEDLRRAVAEREHRSMDVAVDAVPAFEVRVNRARAEPLQWSGHSRCRSEALTPGALGQVSGGSHNGAASVNRLGHPREHILFPFQGVQVCTKSENMNIRDSEMRNLKCEIRN